MSLHAVFRTSLSICATLTTLSASRMTSDRLRITDPAGEAFRVRGFDNWRTFVRTGANMLIVGPRCALDAFVRVAEAELAQPIRYVRPLDEVPADCQGTIVLLDAARLDDGQQDGLRKCVGNGGGAGARVISLSEAHLWRRDHALIPLDLYYRLNTICLEIDDANR